MSVYNGERYLREAMDSILSQTFHDFEFLIINDGSTDGSSEIICSYKDPRIRLINFDTNKGLIAALNKGIGLAQGSYIVRMDTDDVSLPMRIEKQVNFMDRNPDIGAAGSWAVTIGMAKSRKIITETNTAMLRCKLFFANPLLHPTVIIRTCVLQKYNLLYDAAYCHSEDYKMWLDISEHTKLSNVPEVLLKYRIHPHQTSQEFHLQQCANAAKIATQLFLKLKMVPSSEKIKMHCSIGFGDYSFELHRIKEWFLELEHANESTHIYPRRAFLQTLAQKWADVCFRKTKPFYWVKESFLSGSFLDKHSFLNFHYSLIIAIKNFRGHDLLQIIQQMKEKFICAA